MERRIGSGCKAKIFDLRKRCLLKRYFDHRDNVTITSGAKKFKVARSTIRYWLRKLKIKRYSKKRSPKYTQAQAELARRQCAWLYNKYKSKKFVIDDESYFGLTWTSNKSFFSSSLSDTSDDVIYKGKAKFEPKVMLWIAISENGLSKPYFRSSKLAVDQIIYQNECIKKRLLPFINKYHDDGEYIFWSDKASSHYAKLTISLLKHHKVKFVEKYRNPTNVPQCRPIEDFFGILKANVYKNGWSAKNIRQLQNRIRLCLRKIDPQVVQRTMESVKKRLRNCGLKGVYSVCH